MTQHQIGSAPCRPIPVALRCAATAAERLIASGCVIHSTFHNGRRMVLLVDHPPAFVSGHMKSRHPNGKGGLTTLYAAGFHGCQLEWTKDEAQPAAQTKPIY